MPSPIQQKNKQEVDQSSLPQQNTVQTKSESTIQAKQKPVQAKQKAIQAKQKPVQRNGTGNKKSTEIAHTMGQQYGVDTSSLEFNHNSSFPGKVNAEATIQGNKIDFAPGKDSESNIKHEVGHHIVNTKRGTPPKADASVNGQAVNTTDEVAADKIMNTPLQMKSNTTAPPVSSTTSGGPIQANFGESLIQLKNITIVRMLINKYGKNGVRTTEAYVEKLRNSSDKFSSVKDIADRFLDDKANNRLAPEDMEGFEEQSQVKDPNDLYGIGYKQYNSGKNKKRYKDSKTPTKLSSISHNTKKLDWAPQKGFRKEKSMGIKAYRGDNRPPEKIKSSGGFTPWSPMSSKDRLKFLSQMYGLSTSLTSEGVHQAWINKNISPKPPKGVMVSLGLDTDSGGFSQSDYFYEIHLPPTLHHVIPTEEMMGEPVKFQGHAPKDSLLLMDTDDPKTATHIALLHPMLHEITFLTNVPFHWIREVTKDGYGKSTPDKLNEDQMNLKTLKKYGRKPFDVNQLSVDVFAHFFDKMLLKGNEAATRLAEQQGYDVYAVYDVLCSYNQYFRIVDGQMLWHLRGG
ncbi:hypothetical protein [uncultured Microscilla sp.]|uniref:hypothetical protein n=1 Tax=uncultured Microscilla sp. TaxID=432653 RepID=UPI00261DBA03|nr:hypothetical protein [uncultured Microscilla sp.]